MDGSGRHARQRLLTVAMVIDDPSALDESTQPRGAYRKANWYNFKADCKRLLYDELISEDVTSSYEHLVNAIIAVAERYVPTIKPSKNPSRRPIPY